MGKKVLDKSDDSTVFYSRKLRRITIEKKRNRCMKKSFKNLFFPNTAFSFKRNMSCVRRVVRHNEEKDLWKDLWI